jgi:hypothetical protein
MAFAEKKVKGGKTEVYNTKNGHITAKHTTKMKADRQKRLLNQVAWKKKGG